MYVYIYIDMSARRGLGRTARPERRQVRQVVFDYD